MFGVLKLLNCLNDCLLISSIREAQTKRNGATTAWRSTTTQTRTTSQAVSGGEFCLSIQGRQIFTWYDFNVYI